jgi:hypothetical protein
MRAFMDELCVLRASGGGSELVMTKRLPVSASGSSAH